MAKKLAIVPLQNKLGTKLNTVQTFRNVAMSGEEKPGVISLEIAVEC